MSDELDIALRLASALGIGLLIGLERGWRDRTLEEGRRIAGFRTCAAVALLGAVAGLLGETFGDVLLVATLALALGVLLAVGYWHDIRASGDLSITTVVAVLIAFVLGTLAGVGQIAAAATVAVVVTLLLGHKPEMHGLLAHLDRAELLAALRLLLISVVLLPLLPNRGFGPFEAINPYQVWWLVVLIAAISFAGYFAMKLAGTKRGILLTGFLGGLASSTAVTVNLARLGREHNAAHRLVAGGIVLAGAVMFPRLLGIIAIFSPPTVMLPLTVLGPAMLASALAALWLASQANSIAVGEHTRLEPDNPLNLRAAIQFGILLALLSLLSRGAQEWMGTAGLYALAALSGLADVDAITLSLLSGRGSGLDDTTIGFAVIIAATVNTLMKAALALGIGGARIGLDVAVGLGAAFAGGAVGLAIYFAL